jgi:type VI protein secretion system component VasK
METVASKTPSPAVQAELNDEVVRIRNVAATDSNLENLFQAIEELTGKGESVSAANISQHLDLPRKQVAQSIQKLRAAARRNI